MDALDLISKPETIVIRLGVVWDVMKHQERLRYKIELIVSTSSKRRSGDHLGMMLDTLSINGILEGEIYLPIRLRLTSAPAVSQPWND